MGRVEATVMVNAPIEAVWNCLNDIDHTPEWVVGLEASELTTSGPYGVGSVYIDYNRIGSMRQVTPWRVTAFEPMTHQVHQSESATLPSTLAFNLTPVSDSVRVQMVIDYRFLPRLGGVSRLLETVLMNNLLKQVVKQNLSNLNAYLGKRQGQADPA